MIFDGNIKTNIQVSLINNIKSNQLDSNIWKIFDKIFCIHYLPYEDRFIKIKKQLKRLGILNLNQFDFFNTVPNKYFDLYFLDNIDKTDYSSIHIKNINLQINRFNLLSICNKLKFNRILILEDDIRFLNNINIIQKYIENFPVNYDIVNMDPWFFNFNQKIELLNNQNAKINEYYSNLLNSNMVFNASMISLSSKAIEFLIKNIQKKFRPMDNYIFHRNDTVGDNLKMAFSNINLCIQNEIGDRQDELLNDKYNQLNLEKYYNE